LNHVETHEDPNISKNTSRKCEKKTQTNPQQRLLDKLGLENEKKSLKKPSVTTQKTITGLMKNAIQRKKKHTKTCKLTVSYQGDERVMKTKSKLAKLEEKGMRSGLTQV